MGERGKGGSVLYRALDSRKAAPPFRAKEEEKGEPFSHSSKGVPSILDKKNNLTRGKERGKNTLSPLGETRTDASRSSMVYPLSLFYPEKGGKKGKGKRRQASPVGQTISFKLPLLYQRGNASQEEKSMVPTLYLAEPGEGFPLSAGRRSLLGKSVRWKAQIPRARGRWARTVFIGGGKGTGSSTLKKGAPTWRSSDSTEATAFPTFSEGKVQKISIESYHHTTLFSSTQKGGREVNRRNRSCSDPCENTHVRGDRTRPSRESGSKSTN